MNYQPAVSIIIAVKNAKEHLKQTLESLIRQHYAKLEVIVIDGGSEDGTLDVIQDYQKVISSWVTEKDEGIADAFNKGLKRAKGEYINFQGAGDILYHENCIAELFSDLDSSAILVCGKILRVEEDGITPLWSAPKHTNFKPSSLLFKMSLPHQGLFTHRAFFDTFGEFDTSVKFAMDYELLLRAYHKFPKTVIKDIFISKWRAGGIGQHRINEIFDEYHRIKMQHGIASIMVLRLINRYIRLKNSLKRIFKLILQ